jgi:hypothetical protein
MKIAQDHQIMVALVVGVQPALLAPLGALQPVREVLALQ